MVEKMRQKLDPEIFLRIHVINNFTFDDEIFDTDADMMMKEQEMEDGQSVKRNSYLKLVTNFTNNHPIPTENIDLINIHEKNLRL